MDCAAFKTDNFVREEVLHDFYKLFQNPDVDNNLLMEIEYCGTYTIQRLITYDSCMIIFINTHRDYQFLVSKGLGPSCLSV